MELAVLRLSDRFYEIGNSIFNVEGLNYTESCELNYESSEEIVINKAFYTVENNVSEFRLYLLVLIKNIYSLLLSKKESKLSNSANSKISNMISRNSKTASVVISDNVRSRLLSIINEDIDIYVNNSKKNASSSKTNKNKNQFIRYDDDKKDKNNKLKFKEFMLHRLIFVNRIFTKE